MSYAVDITRPRNKLAMLTLGIEPEELLLKSLEDFAIRGVSEEIQKLRFNYYSRKLQEVVRQLNAFIREETLRKLQTNINSPKGQVFLTQLSTCEEEVDEIAEIKKQEQKKLKKNFQSLNDSILINEQIEKRLRLSDEIRDRVRSEIVEKRMKMQKFKDKQQENWAKIQKEMDKKGKQYVPTRPNEGKSEVKTKTCEVMSRFSRTLTEFNESDEEVEMKISQFDGKMLRSQRLYEKCVQQKKEAASKLLEKNNFHRIEEEPETEIEKITKMVEKRKRVEARRHSYMVELQEHRDTLRQKHEERRSVALERVKKEEKMTKDRNLAIERRMEASEMFLKLNHQKLMKELEMKNELSKLRDEEALLNAERKRRIM